MGFRVLAYGLVYLFSLENVFYPVCQQIKKPAQKLFNLFYAGLHFNVPFKFIFQLLLELNCTLTCPPNSTNCTPTI